MLQTILSMGLALALQGETAAPTWRAGGPSVTEAAKDPKIAAVLEAVSRIDTALLTDDRPAFAAALASDFSVNTPENRVAPRAGVVARNAQGQIAYARYERTIDYAGLRGDMVVLMGEERVTPKGASPDAGKRVTRRFTDLWRQEDGRWRLTARQATILKVEEPAP